MKIQNFLPLFAGLGAIAIWSLAPALLKTIVQNVPITNYLFLRFLFSILILSPVVKSLYTVLPKIRFKSLAFFAMAACLNFYLQAFALKGLPTSWYITLFSLSPLFMLMTMKSRFSANNIVTILICLLGTSLFIRTEEIYLIGLMPFVFLVLSLGTWIALTKAIVGLQASLNDLQISTLMNLLGFLMIAPIWVFQADFSSWMEIKKLGCILAMAALMPLAFLFYSISLRHTPKFAILSQYLEPVFGCLIALFILNERVGGRQWVGIGLICFGLSDTVTHIFSRGVLLYRKPKSCEMQNNS